MSVSIFSISGSLVSVSTFLTSRRRSSRKLSQGPWFLYQPSPCSCPGYRYLSPRPLQHNRPEEYRSISYHSISDLYLDWNIGVSRFVLYLRILDFCFSPPICKSKILLRAINRSLVFCVFSPPWHHDSLHPYPPLSLSNIWFHSWGCFPLRPPHQSQPSETYIFLIPLLVCSPVFPSSIIPSKDVPLYCRVRTPISYISLKYRIV